jgi:hypothetical protein
MVWFIDVRNRYLRLSEPMFLTLGTYIFEMWKKLQSSQVWIGNRIFFLLFYMQLMATLYTSLSHRD